MGDWRRKAGDFVPLKANYLMDPAILAAVSDAGAYAELAFLRSLAVAKLCDADGYLMWSQCAPVRARLRRFDDVRDALVEHKLWIPAPDASGFRIRSWSNYNAPRDERASIEAAKEQARLRQQRHRGKVRESAESDVSRVTSQPRALIGEERRGTTDRSPSGSDRSVARTAPRGSEGAAPPAPTSDVVRSELLAETRKQIAESKAQFRGKENRPTVGNGRAEHVDFSATLAKLTEMAGEADE